MWLRLPILIVLAGCGPRSSDDSGDSGNVKGGTTSLPSGYDGPTMLDSIVAPGCDKANEFWIYKATTLGWTGGHNIVNAWETGNPDGWNEEHSLPSDTFGPLNSFDIVKQSLDPGAENANFTADFNTIFACGVHDAEPVMTYTIRIYNMNQQYVDCAIFSTQGQAGIDMVFNGRAPDGNKVSNATEL